MNHMNDDGELIEAFQAQKLVNRQLESELTAMTDDNNATLAELNKQIDDLRVEKNELQIIVYDKLERNEENDSEALKRNENYLRYEIEKVTAFNTELQEKLNYATKKLESLIKNNLILSNRLRDNGLNNSIQMTDEIHDSLTSVKKKNQSYQGIIKYRPEDENKILHRLIVELKPRVAITLLPGLPAYIIFMCIRYTDLLNADQHVRTLLTNFILLVKKTYKLPKTTECRVLWLVNTLTIHNLLKQYGGIDEYIQMNTETQNQQQLKNFDLSEYRAIIYENIINIHGMLLRQVQELIKNNVVPAILDHDEMARGKGNRSRTMSLDMSPDQNHVFPEPKSLVNQLEHFHKQFQFFGLDDSYIEQIFKQLLYYICAVALNNLMLRQELCIWKTGMKIRYNVSCLEEWVRKKKMSSEVLAPLLPLIQVSSLLQSRKSEQDVQSICDLCTQLTKAQVLKVCGFFCCCCCFFLC